MPARFDAGMLYSGDFHTLIWSFAGCLRKASALSICIVERAWTEKPGPPPAYVASNASCIPHSFALPQGSFVGDPGARTTTRRLMFEGFLSAGSKDLLGRVTVSAIFLLSRCLALREDRRSVIHGSGGTRHVLARAS